MIEWILIGAFAAGLILGFVLGAYGASDSKRIVSKGASHD